MPSRELGGMSPARISEPPLVFLRTVWALDHGLQSHSKRRKAQKGVTGPQRLVLRVLELAPGAAPSELARILCFHKSTVSVILRSLEQAGLVHRSPNTTDARAVVLTLTPKGRHVVEQRAGTVEAVVRATLDRLPPRNVQIAQRVLDTLSRALGAVE
jgi:DNA-binding MarR family transcriptional regulator